MEWLQRQLTPSVHFSRLANRPAVSLLSVSRSPGRGSDEPTGSNASAPVSSGISVHLRDRAEGSPSSIPAFVFANVTSLPLLLLATMSKTEAFEKVLVPSGEDIEAVISRGRIYILLNALFNHITRFTIGPCELHYCISQLLLTGYCFCADLMQSYSDTSPKRGAIALPIGEGAAPRARNVTIWRRTKRALAVIWECINPPMIGGAAGILAGMAPQVLHDALFDDKGWASP